LKKVLYFFALILIYSCANQLPPSGGPVDKEPPLILNLYPENGTINFENDYFEFSFSEYVDKRSFQDAFFISPKIDSKFEYDWSGKRVRVYFDKEKLKKNTTYTINIGTDLVDLNNKNKMAKSYNLFFSTGNKIDDGRINGKIYFSDAKDAFIFAYRDSSDTLNPSIVKPDYLTQVAKDGSFNLVGLGDGKYKIFAFTDDLRNLLYNVGEDKFSVPFKDIELKNNENLIESVNLILSLEDTLKPNIANITMTDKNHILVEFSEFIDSSKISVNNFSIIDSSARNSIKIKYLFKNAKPKTYFLCIGDSLNNINDNYLVVESISDLNKNLSDKQELFITQTKLADTLKPKVVSITTKYENKTIDLEGASFTINFNDGININEILDSCRLTNSKNEVIKIEKAKIDDSSILINILEKLKPKSKLKFIISTNQIYDAAGNKIDSLFKAEINTVDDLIFTGVSGKVKTKNAVKRKIKIENKQNNYLQTLNDKDEFNFKNVIPGKYLLWLYEDADSNDVYTNGKVFPFKKSEKFYVFPDTLNLRARWPVGDIEIDY